MSGFIRAVGSPNRAIVAFTSSGVATVPMSMAVAALSDTTIISHARSSRVRDRPEAK
jgi:hypothetical protein